MTVSRLFSPRLFRATRLVSAFLVLCVWLVVPLTVGQWGRMPHTHVLIGSVTDMDMAEHLAREQPHATVGHDEDTLPHWEHGWILSVPFGNPAVLFTFLFSMAPVQGVVWMQHAWTRVFSDRDFLAKQIHLPVPFPPPRAECVCERVPV